IVTNTLDKHVEVGTIVRISAPAGDFVLDVQDKRPLVLMSGGVGLTPMISMLETVITKQPEREVIFIHAARNGKVHAMRERVKEIAENHNVTTYSVYDSPEKQDYR